jgi:hypothetical protein
MSDPLYRPRCCARRGGQTSFGAAVLLEKERVLQDDKRFGSQVNILKGDARPLIVKPPE